jgi:hypothetical protein
MTTSTIDRARLEELLGEYWEIAFEESSGVAATGNKANRVLHEIRALFDVKQAEIARLKTESEERLQNCAALVAENEQLRKDAERYRWCVDNNMVLAGGTTAFGWPIAPVGREEWDRYIDYTKNKP